MGRLIDIDRLCDDLMERWSVADKKKEDLIRAVMTDVVTPIVVSQPTVDAVPVVRCKDCKYWRRDTDHTCKEHSLVSPMLADGFCSRGKRKDGDNEKAD